MLRRALARVVIQDRRPPKDWMAVAVRPREQPQFGPDGRGSRCPLAARKEVEVRVGRRTGRGLHGTIPACGQSVPSGRAGAVGLRGRRDGPEPTDPPTAVLGRMKGQAGRFGASR